MTTSRARFLGVTLAVLSLVIGLFTGCANADSRLQGLADRIRAAVNQGDREAFIELFDPQLASQTVSMWWTNLEQMDLRGLSVVEAGVWHIAWTWPGRQQLWHARLDVGTRCGVVNGCLITSISQHERSDGTRDYGPIWLYQDVEVHGAGNVDLIAANDSWDQVIDVDVMGLFDAVPLAGLFTFGDSVMIAIPDDEDVFEHVMAAPALNYRYSGAITVNQARDFPDSPALSVIINPTATAQASLDQRRALVIHELTHIATQGLDRPVAGRGWLAEGVAEYMAYQVSDAHREQASEILSRRCAIDDQPPSDDAFEALDGAHADYAWSGRAVEMIVTAEDDPVDTIRLLWQGEILLPEYLNQVCDS